MKKAVLVLVDIIGAIAVFFAAFTLIFGLLGYENATSVLTCAWVITVIIALSGRFIFPKLNSRRLSILRAGWNHLLIFGISCLLTLVAHLISIFFIKEGDLSFTANLRPWLFNLIFVLLAEGLMFWSGMLRVFFTSEQLAIKWRVIAFGCGFIPIVNLIVLIKMMVITGKEIQYENERLALQEARKDQKLCQTKYPLLMVHGIFFRDFDYLNYWGRIPKALEENGARIFYGEHMSSASVEECGEDLAMRIRHVCELAGSDKVNVIAHSKGGLDTRCAISKFGADKYVASLTTINTPHRGCEFAEFLLNKIPKAQQEAVAGIYNKTFKKLGDEEPNFIEGVSDLTFSACEKFNEETPDVEGVYYQSVGSRQNSASSGRFPVNMSYAFVKHFDGENDGLVGKKSFPWGSDFKYLAIEGKRGISHADMIDLNRENFDGFDVREFYIDLVHDLKEKGY